MQLYFSHVTVAFHCSVIAPLLPFAATFSAHLPAHWVIFFISHWKSNWIQAFTNLMAKTFCDFSWMKQLPHKRWKGIERGEERLAMCCKPMRYHYLQICNNNLWWGCQNTKFNTSAWLLFNYCCSVMQKILSLHALPPLKDDIARFFHCLTTYTLSWDGIFPRGPTQGRKCRVISVVCRVQLKILWIYSPFWIVALQDCSKQKEGILVPLSNFLCRSI